MVALLFVAIFLRRLVFTLKAHSYRLQIFLLIFFLFLAGLYVISLSHKIIITSFSYRLTFFPVILEIFLGTMPTLPISTLSWIVILLLTSITALSRANSQSAFAEMAIITITFSLGTILYIIGLLYLYLFCYTLYEGIILASFSRYISEYLAIWTLTFFILILHNFWLNKPKQQQLDWLIIAIIPSFALLVMPWSAISFILKQQTISPMQKRIINEARQIKISVPKNKKVYIIWQNNDASLGFFYEIGGYELFPRHYNNDCFSIGAPFSRKDIWTCKNINNAKTFSAHIKGYDYLWLANKGPNFWKIFGNAFYKNKPGAFLYKIQTIKNEVRLSPVNEAIN